MDKGGRPVGSLVEGCPCDGCELFVVAYLMDLKNKEKI